MIQVAWNWCCSALQARVCESLSGETRRVPSIWHSWVAKWCCKGLLPFHPIISCSFVVCPGYIRFVESHQIFSQNKSFKYFRSCYHFNWFVTKIKQIRDHYISLLSTANREERRSPRDHKVWNQIFKQKNKTTLYVLIEKTQVNIINYHYEDNS